MKVTMVEINKEASSIINQVSKTGESAIIYKHGRAIVEIRALPSIHTTKQDIAYKNLLRLQPTKVDESITEMIAKGRQRGI